MITLFGCGGDRDRTKRPLMGMAAAEFSDFVVLTSDNPRSEDPLDIMNDVMVGLAALRHAACGRARSRARRFAIAISRKPKPGDVVLLAGKGHETYQILKDRTIHFDDRETARRSSCDLWVIQEHGDEHENEVSSAASGWRTRWG